jgi:hypothetical protein
MDKSSVYIETSIVSYLAADPSRHPVTLRNQQLTHEWWNTHRERYALYTSTAVTGEAAEGDSRMVERRRALLSPIPLLAESADVQALADHLRKTVPLPPRADTDAAHVAYAAVYGMAYLLTWNCRHIANPRLIPRIARICASRGFECPVLCTPEQLLRE